MIKKTGRHTGPEKGSKSMKNRERWGKVGGLRN